MTFLPMTPSYTSRLFGPILSLRTSKRDFPPVPKASKQVETPPSYNWNTTTEIPRSFVPKTFSVIVEDERVFIHLDSDIDFEYIAEELKTAMRCMNPQFNGYPATMVFYDRIPNRIEVRRLFGILRDSNRLHLTEVHTSEAALCRFAAQEHKLRFMIVDEQTKAEPLPPRVPAQPLISHRTIRSGSLLSSEGDIIIYGDVNAGAVIQSAGNVTVLGKLLGAVYVPKNRFIVALDFNPLQLRFGDQVFTSIDIGTLKKGPMIVRFEDELVIQPYHQQYAKSSA